MADNKIILWFDIDNTLYPKSARIGELMGQRIHAYFVGLDLDEEAAHRLHMKYVTEYGLAIRGLSRHHEIDPVDFDEQCDGSLPLEDILRPDPNLILLFRDIDRSKAHVWALTNAYKKHARRVLRILELEDEIEGLVYCDYTNADFTCKPEPAFFEMALSRAGISDPSRSYFVDDSLKNVQAAKALGWGSCVYFLEHDDPEAQASHTAFEGVDHTIHDLQQLRIIWPEVFRPATTS